MAKVVALVSSGRYRQEHYEDVANVLHNHNLRGSCEDGLDGECRACNVTDAISHDFARLFAADNPDFSRERFLTACGLES